MVTFLAYALLMKLKALLSQRVTTIPRSPASEMDNAGPMRPMRSVVSLSPMRDSRSHPIRHGSARDPPLPDHAAVAGTTITLSACRTVSKILSKSSADPAVA
jgi:hypothetical protein